MTRCSLHRQHNLLKETFRSLYSGIMHNNQGVGMFELTRQLLRAENPLYLETSTELLDSKPRLNVERKKLVRNKNRSVRTKDCTQTMPAMVRRGCNQLIPHENTGYYIYLSLCKPSIHRSSRFPTSQHRWVPTTDVLAPATQSGSYPNHSTMTAPVVLLCRVEITNKPHSNSLGWRSEVLKRHR